MTLQTNLTDNTVSAVLHAAQHNEANTDVLQFLAGAIGSPQVTITGTPSANQVPVATASNAASWQAVPGAGSIGSPLVALSGTPSANKIPVATGTTTATWQTVPGAGTVGTPQITLTGTPSLGQVPVATTSSAATWQTPPAGVPPLTPTGTKTTAYTAVANDWVLCDTTSASFSVTSPATPADKTIFAVTWVAGSAPPTITGSIVGAPAFGVIGNTIGFQYTTVLNKWLVQ